MIPKEAAEQAAKRIDRLKLRLKRVMANAREVADDIRTQIAVIQTEAMKCQK